MSNVSEEIDKFKTNCKLRLSVYDASNITNKLLLSLLIESFQQGMIAGVSVLMNKTKDIVDEASNYGIGQS